MLERGFHRWQISRFLTRLLRILRGRVSGFFFNLFGFYILFLYTCLKNGIPDDTNVLFGFGVAFSCLLVSFAFFSFPFPFAGSHFLDCSDFLTFLFQFSYCFSSFISGRFTRHDGMIMELSGRVYKRWLSSFDFVRDGVLEFFIFFFPALRLLGEGCWE